MARDDLIPIAEFGSSSETDVVVALLQSRGVPALRGGRYNWKAPQQVLVPRRAVERARRVIGEARKSGEYLRTETSQTAEERRSIGTAAIWIMAIGMSGCALFVAGRFVRDLIRYFFG